MANIVTLKSFSDLSLPLDIILNMILQVTPIDCIFCQNLILQKNYFNIFTTFLMHARLLILQELLL